MGNLFASTGLGDEKPHERDVELRGFAGRRPYERQNENPEIMAVHMDSTLHRLRTVCAATARLLLTILKFLFLLNVML